jgi:hypothetical protein
LELFGIPGHSTPEVTVKIEQRYNQALKDRNRLVVPLPCIFELGNHIAQARVARVGWSERSELQQLSKAMLEFANAHSNLHGLQPTRAVISN